LEVIDPNLAVPPARRVVDLDSSCKECRNHLGALYAFAILRLADSDDKGSSCLPKTPDAEQSITRLRSEIASFSDPEILIVAGMTLRGYSGIYGSRCGGNVKDVVEFGGMLVKQAVALAPSLIETFKLQDTFNAAPANSNPKPGNTTPAASKVRLSEEDALQRLIHQEEVVYPELARQAHVEGPATFEITVDTGGEVLESSVVLCHPLLCSAAMNALQKYRYTPLLIQGKPRSFKASVQVRFNLP
jgi:TonB family protein